MRGSAVELLEDCPHCRLEAGLVETYDASVSACRFGVPARVSCKLCGLTKVGRFSVETTLDLTTLPTNRCPACREVLRPEALDVRRCAACGAHAGLEDERAPEELSRFPTFHACLTAWAERESFEDADALVSATFVAEDTRALHAAYLRGEPLETIADPFAFGGRASGGALAPPPSSSRSRAKRTSAAPPSIRVVPSAERAPSTKRMPNAPNAHLPASLERPTATPPPAPVATSSPREGASLPHSRTPAPTDVRGIDQPPLSAPPRAILFPLVSVISADGEIHPAERAFVDAFLVSEGMAPLADHELKVYTPAEAARYVPKERREKIVELMCEVAMVDGLADDAELRVVRAYAAAWQVSEEKVETWLWGYEHAQASAARQFWLRIRRFVLSSRWESTDP